LKIISETYLKQFKIGVKINKKRIGPNLTELGRIQQKPKRAGPDNASPGRETFEIELTGGAYASGDLSHPNRYAAVGF
jgi:hypothetical protein